MPLAGLANVPDSIKNDRLWEFSAYQKALLLYDLMWEDCEKMLLSDVRGRGNADQLNRSVGSISANIEEGYGRGFGKEYDYFLRVALGPRAKAGVGTIAAGGSYPRQFCSIVTRCSMKSSGCW